MRDLQFKKFIFRSGFNFTVRLGTKWKEVEIGEAVKVVQSGNPANFRQGEVRKIYVCRTQDLPLEVYYYEHDPDAATYAGLKNAMFIAYPELNSLDYDSAIVTCVGFMVFV
jgi:hypothetical protein